MIERFSLTAEIGELMEKFDVRKVMKGHTGRFNITPTQNVSIIMNDRHDLRVLQESRWGLFPFWAKDSVNTDYQTLGDKPFLARMLKRQRCVIPCSGFYGQKKFGQERDPRAMHTIVPNQPLLGIAGIYDCWRHVNGKEVRAFTMLTAASSGAMSVWQPRVPVVLDEEGIEDWLDPKLTEFNRVRKHLEAMESYLMRSYPVTNAVRDELYESPDCVMEIRMPDFA
ncbi:SOS response-associated peptidase [Paenibacillus sp. LHD-117]|uniref:SOS response-associated peptidase n=1 Tax=Paenibacillus sp. LHD-117 TaxID=3071412 RepID=UPI0027E0B3A7|nr:SOS response-associated peptidase [Paenibacillus sp. LHD-117]MDQ6421317.1 SOS response-associated peptidase [Paenibacillus sp. LHD-117]